MRAHASATHYSRCVLAQMHNVSVRQKGPVIYEASNLPQSSSHVSSRGADVSGSPVQIHTRIIRVTVLLITRDESSRGDLEDTQTQTRSAIAPVIALLCHVS